MEAMAEMEGRSLLTRSSLRLLEEFQIVNEDPQATRVSAPEVVKWRTPRPGCYKVNVDGAVFSKRKQAGIGVVIRDSGGSGGCCTNQENGIATWCVGNRS